MDALYLEEVDSLEAIVIIDNELDPMSPAAPDTVQMTGLMGTIGMNSQHRLTDRGDAHAELRMDDICCSAHGLSILVVRQNNPSIPMLCKTLILSRPQQKETRATRFSSTSAQKKMHGSRMSSGYGRTCLLSS